MIPDEPTALEERIQNLINNMLQEMSVERVKVSSTAKGFRLEGLTVHRHDGEDWRQVAQRVGTIINQLEHEIGTPFV